MTGQADNFWQNFNAKDFEQALEQFKQLGADQQHAIFEQLYQRGGHAEMPFIVSVLRRKLHDGQTFEDFYQSWEPDPKACNPIDEGGTTYRQFFPVSTRVINGINIADDSDIISVGFTWVKNEAEKQGLYQYIESASKGDDDKNNARRENIKESAEGGLIGLYVVEKDDNLGSPF